MLEASGRWIIAATIETVGFNAAFTAIKA